MMGVAAIVLATILVAIGAANLLQRRKRRRRHRAQNRLYTHRDRDWWVANWLFGRRGIKRLTDRRGKGE